MLDMCSVPFQMVARAIIPSVSFWTVNSFHCRVLESKESYFFHLSYLLFRALSYRKKWLNNVHLCYYTVHMLMSWFVCSINVKVGLAKTKALTITRSTPCPCSSCSCLRFLRCWLASLWQRCRWTAPSCWCSCDSRPRGTTLRLCSGICTWRREGWECTAPPPLQCRPPSPSCCWTLGRPPTCPGSRSFRCQWDWLQGRQRYDYHGWTKLAILSILSLLL